MTTIELEARDLTAGRSRRRSALNTALKTVLSAVMLFAAVTAQLHYGIGITYSVISAGLLAWYAFQPGNTVPLKIMLLTVSIVGFSLVEREWFHFVDLICPMKYDHVLARIDQRWLFDGSVCRRFAESSPVLETISVDIYEGIAFSLIFWLGWLLAAHGPAGKFMKAIVLAYSAGPLFYLLVPACGPLYAGSEARPMLVLLHGYPNCFPSLHMATALLILLFRPSRTGGLFAILLSITTAFTTLATGQHYVVDLVFAVPFAGFSYACVQGRKRRAAILLLVVTVGAVAIHFAPHL